MTRIMATLHDERIPIGTLGELAEALRPLADNGQVWASVIDGHLCIVCEDHAMAAPATRVEVTRPGSAVREFIEGPAAVPPRDELAEFEAEFRAAWVEHEGVTAAVAKAIAEPLHTVIRTARRLGLSQAAAS